MGPPHDRHEPNKHRQAGRQQLERRGQREKENRKQRQRKGTERLKEQKVMGKRQTRAKTGWTRWDACSTDHAVDSSGDGRRDVYVWWVKRFEAV